MKRKLRVGILFGGKSGEHEVSIASGQSVWDALDKNKYEAVPIAIDRQGRWLAGGAALKQLKGGEGGEGGEGEEGGEGRTQNAQRSSRGREGEEGEEGGEGGRRKAEGGEQAAARDSQSNLDITSLVTRHSPVLRDVSPKGGLTHGSPATRRSPLADIDVVFPILHGPMGEDGTVQGLLELADIPYVGAGVAASAVGMDKELMKTIFAAHGLPIVNYLCIKRREWDRRSEQEVRDIEAQLSYPVFVKPVNLGSSVGVSKVHTRAELEPAIALACTFDRKVLIEQGMNAREVECSVLGNDEPIVSVVGEVRTRRREFYDYIAKYTDGEADLIIPADLPADKAEEIRALAVRAYRAVDCAGMARVDFFMERESDKVYLNELNTIPGFTRFSMYPKLWEASGLSYAELIDRLIALALERYADKKRSGL